MKTLVARISGFKRQSYTVYTVDAQLNGHTWTVAIRYSTFLAFYGKLKSLDADFNVAFPQKGGWFSSPPPEERQVQLDAFLQHTIDHFVHHNCPSEMTALFQELLQVPDVTKLIDGSGGEEDVASNCDTAVESVGEELVDEVVNGQDAKDVESGQENQCAEMQLLVTAVISTEVAEEAPLGLATKGEQVPAEETKAQVDVVVEHLTLESPVSIPATESLEEDISAVIESIQSTVVCIATDENEEVGASSSSVGEEKQDVVANAQEDLAIAMEDKEKVATSALPDAEGGNHLDVDVHQDADPESVEESVIPLLKEDKASLALAAAVTEEIFDQVVHDVEAASATLVKAKEEEQVALPSVLPDTTSVVDNQLQVTLTVVKEEPSSFHPHVAELASLRTDTADVQHQPLLNENQMEADASIHSLPLIADHAMNASTVTETFDNRMKEAIESVPDDNIVDERFMVSSGIIKKSFVPVSVRVEKLTTEKEIEGDCAATYAELKEKHETLPASSEEDRMFAPFPELFESATVPLPLDEVRMICKNPETNNKVVEQCADEASLVDNDEEATTERTSFVPDVTLTEESKTPGLTQKIRVCEVTSTLALTDVEQSNPNPHDASVCYVHAKDQSAASLGTISTKQNLSIVDSKLYWLLLIVGFAVICFGCSGLLLSRGTSVLPPMYLSWFTTIESTKQTCAARLYAVVEAILYFCQGQV